MTFTKISALMFYRRLVKESCSKRMIYTIWVAIWFLIVSTIALFLVFITTCSPIEAYWRQVYPTYKRFTCRAKSSLLIINETSTAVNVITDVYSLVIPALLVTKLRLTRRQRIAIMFILGIGSMCVFSFEIGQLDSKLIRCPQNDFLQRLSSMVSLLLECKPGFVMDRVQVGRGIHYGNACRRYLCLRTAVKGIFPPVLWRTEWGCGQ
jgi:hypothetical protein